VSDEIKLDLGRSARIGIEEALLCPGKSLTQITAILDRIADAGTTMLLTRLAADVEAALPQHHRVQLDYDPLSRTAWFGSVAPPRASGDVAIVTAGTSDLPVAREAARTLSYHGHAPTEIADVGVAGLWRLTERLPDLRAPRVVIAVAGMDAAIVSVLGGLLGNVLIAVPTSTGYGAARNGETALAASLTSCAPGVVVVNIDNGYGAACAALRVLGSG
jgi:pyridinium-3,5-biscarboxylic acid mononucleotide synthase